MSLQVQGCKLQTRDEVDTHWSRMLYRDYFASDSGETTSDPGKITKTRLRPSVPACSTRHPRGNAHSQCNAERVALLAADGYPITAIRYASMGPARAHLIVAGAIGVPQRFYRRFAEFAASSGYSTMTLDYRGVGLSAPATLEGFKMDYFDWGRLDLAAAVAAMNSPGVPLYMVGHSFGGHAFGVLPNHENVAGLYTFGTGAGWHGWMPPLERVRVLALWHILGPLLTRWKGYLSWSLLGMGEDLPLDFYRQWKHWCRYPNYFFGDSSVRHVVRQFERVRTPVMAANSIDDRWSPPKSRDAFMAGYRNAARQTLDIDPSRVGLRAIGHMGYFKPDAAPLWQSALEWLETRSNVLGPNGYGDVAPAPTAPSDWPTSYEAHRAARAHRALSLGEIIVAGVRAAGAVARRAYARHRQRRRARMTYDALRQLDDHMLRDLGFDRSELTSVAAEAAGMAERSRVRVLADTTHRPGACP